MKILLVRFSAIGDCAMAAHTATCIRRSYPEARLVWAVEARCAPVVDDSSLVSMKAIYPRERWKKGAWSPRIWREQMAYYGALRRERFDIGLDLQGHSKTALCLRLSGAKGRLALRGTDPFARMLNPIFRDFGKAVHTVDRQLAALRSLGGFTGEPSPPIMPPLAEERLAVRAQVGAGPFEIVAVGAGQPGKAYPKEAWAQVAKERIAMGRRVVFIGGPEETAPAVAGAIDLVGKLDLSATMAAIAESSLVLAADTGTGHLAAAYGVPSVSIFGPTDPAEFRPYSPTSLVLKEGTETSTVRFDQVLEAAERACAS